MARCSVHIRMDSRRNTVTCKCTAYPFPHREGGGKCDHNMAPACEDCYYVQVTSDPYAVGNRFNRYFECTLEKCPWGKR